MRALGIMLSTVFTLMVLTLTGVLLVDMARNAPVLFGALLCAAGALGYLAHKARSAQRASVGREYDPARASSTR